MAAAAVVKQQKHLSRIFARISIVRIPLNLMRKQIGKTHSYSILRVPTTQLAKMSIDLKFVKLTADILEN